MHNALYRLKLSQISKKSLFQGYVFQSVLRTRVFFRAQFFTNVIKESFQSLSRVINDNLRGNEKNTFEVLSHS